MSETLMLATENPDVSLRTWANEADDTAYLGAVDEDRTHLSQYGDATSRKYPTLEAVRERRLNPRDSIRLGIWDKGELKGGITATPNDDESEIEIGYWLRASATGHGYATLAVTALTQYLRPQYKRVFAEVHVDNGASAKVLQRAGYTQTGSVGRDWGSAVVFEAKQP